MLFAAFERLSVQHDARKSHFEKRDKATYQAEDVIEVKPEIMELLNAFDTPMKCTKGSSRH